MGLARKPGLAARIENCYLVAGTSGSIAVPSLRASVARGRAGELGRIR